MSGMYQVESYNGLGKLKNKAIISNSLKIK
jgi:hypothetical protein